jgi:hypothetical protein
VQISGKLYDKIKSIIETSQGEFETVEQYVEFVLNEVINKESQQVYTPQEEEEIKKRLRSLGYL